MRLAISPTLRPSCSPWTWLSAWTPAWPTSPALSDGGSGCCCRSSRTGAGGWRAKPRPGFRSCASIARPREAMGAARSSASRRTWRASDLGRGAGLGRRGVAADAFDHGEQAVGALGRERALQPQPLEGGAEVEAQDLVRRAARIEADADGDQATHDVGVAVAVEDQGPVGPRRGDQPHLAGAAAHLGGLRALALGQGVELAAEVDDVPITLFP